MSTRYIWGQHELNKEYEYERYVENEITVGNTGTDYKFIGLSSMPQYDLKKGYFTYSGSYFVRDLVLGVTIVPIYAEDYPYLIIKTGSSWASGTGSGTIDNIYEVFQCSSSLLEGTTPGWSVSTISLNMQGDNKLYLHLQQVINGETVPGASFYWYLSYGDSTSSPGELLGYVSSSSPSAYPNEGESGDYYYKAIENDEIDPSSVTIPNQLIAGENATVTVIQSSGAIASEYGNISYLFSYKYDSESWSQNVQGTGLTYSFNVTSGKSQVIARVYAKDDIGFTSETAVESNVANIYASSPPTAPGSISVNRVVNGWETTIKITAAMDTDGTIVNYKYYAAYKSQNGDIQWPNVNMETATLISTINSLEISYLINSTVENEEIIFLVSAVDDSGVEGPPILSRPYTIEKDKIVLLGPTKTNFGIKISNFKVYFSGIVGGNVLDKTFSLTVKNDDVQLYSNTIDSDEVAEVLIDISSLSEGDHTITVTGSKEGYDTVMASYIYRIQNLVVPENATMVQFQDSTGKAIFPEGDARGIFLSDGTSLEDAITSLGYQLQEGD